MEAGQADRLTRKEAPIQCHRTFGGIKQVDDVKIACDVQHKPNEIVRSACGLSKEKSRRREG